MVKYDATAERVASDRGVGPAPCLCHCLLIAVFAHLFSLVNMSQAGERYHYCFVLIYRSTIRGQRLDVLGLLWHGIFFVSFTAGETLQHTDGHTQITEKKAIRCPQSCVYVDEQYRTKEHGQDRSVCRQ